MTLNSLPLQSSIVSFRQELHQFPELSGKEHATANRIVQFLKQFNPDQVLTGIGGAGVIAVFHGSKTPDGPTILFRAELDALPIQDVNDLPYRSVNAGIGHKCGHDGHMAILMGLASLLYEQKFDNGKVLLLFQPAEETGAGAHDMLQDARLTELNPDYVFALHNLPGVPYNQVVIRHDVFSAASSGMIIELTGRSSHAAEPEKGINPGLAVAELIQELNALVEQKDYFQDLTLLTVIHARLGEVAFGTNPGFATVMATLRAFKQGDFDKLKELASEKAETIAIKHNLRFTIRFTEEFPATENHPDGVKLIKESAYLLDLPVIEASDPFRWSEDFAHFTKKYKGALFGLGSGTDQPQLHHPDYDFPDMIIPAGAHLFYNISKLILNK